MFNFIDIYSFIPVSGCVGMGTSALLHNIHILAWGAYVRGAPGQLHSVPMR
jgi:hypothetical protein